jgi:hypothetical protein
MKLFTKPGCEKCDYVKKLIPERMAIKTYDVTEVDGLAELAYLELVSLAEKEMPILVLRDGGHVAGALPIKQALKNYC